MNLKNLLFLFVVFPLVSKADVDLKSGSYRDFQIDLLSKGGNEKFIRIYESRATKEGWFGFGWGSVYQTKLNFTKEGDFYILENGLNNKFYNKQFIKKTKEGFSRELPTGQIDYFNKEGRLEKISNLGKKDNISLLKYDSKNKLISVERAGVNILLIDWQSDGKIKSITNNSKIKSQYFYDEMTNLLKSIDGDGNVSTYAYDINHNLIGANYSGKRKIILKYNQDSFVKEMTDADGVVTSYQYGSNPKNPKYHYWTNVFSNKGKYDSRHEYEIKTSKDGSPYTYRYAVTKNNITTDTIFSECCALPVRISKDNENVYHTYNSKNQLIKKTFNNGNFVSLEYDDHIQKIIKATNQSGWTKFTYDKKTRLSGAVSSKKDSVDLIYEYDNSNIKTILYKKNKNGPQVKMDLYYDLNGQLLKVEVDNATIANIIYKANGELSLEIVSKNPLKSSANKEINQVFESFINLLSPVLKL